MKQRREGVGADIAIQSWLRPALTPVGANKDYEQFRDLLARVDALLRDAHLETLAMDLALEGFEAADRRQLKARKRFAMTALRVSVLRHLLGNPGLRTFSRMVASSDLMADFCGVRRLDGIKGISKSTVERATKLFSSDQVRWLQQVLTEMAGEPERAGDLGLSAPIETDVCLVDTTCLDANIHFPVDWVLLRDVSRTLLKATKLIRSAGLLRRMPCEPEELAGQMNRLCLQMTHARRRADGPRQRKAVLRRMKRLLRTIGEHAHRHRDRLADEFAQTRYSEAQAGRIIKRIDGMLAQLPQVIEQAHERIIGGRQVANADKILSVYEPDIHVLVRGKAGREVEFGNTLFIAESRQGLILDWQLFQGQAPAEWRQLHESLERQNQFDLPGEIEAVCADRGFSSRESSRRLDQAGVYDAVCPRDPSRLAERMSEERFAPLQRRRGSTEARIAIVKQGLGRRLRARGFNNRNLAVAWGVLGHNLWIIARLLADQQKVQKAA